MAEKTDTKTETSKKAYTYRGKTIEELQQLGVREFAQYVKARQRRYMLRQFQELEDFINKSKKKLGKGKAIRTHKRHLVITPAMVGMKIGVHNGKDFVPVDIAKEMLGHRLGEFAATRGKVKHGAAGIGATKGSKTQAKK